jgi:uncharacterized protein YecE (DUF72 family)
VCTEEARVGFIRFGTCSWKYPSWQGLVYSKASGINYLSEYAKRYDTVEVDQWFWSLFDADRPALPKRETVKEYAESVPDGFLFTIKAPNSITLTHFYKKSKSEEPRPNPHFFSRELMEEFLERLSPLGPKIGMLMFQFEYLNRQKMGSEAEFLSRLGDFVSGLPGGYSYGIETRNPNYLDEKYFEFLAGRGLAHVFLQGYYMPSIVGTYSKFRDHIRGTTVIRLHGGEREEIERETKGKWNAIVTPRDGELGDVADMIRDLENRKINSFINVNNHYEGSSPITIDRLRSKIAGETLHAG